MKKIKTYNIGKATTFDLNQLSSDLEPGKYTIKTQAISVNGKESKESIGVEYEVKDPLNPLGLPPFTIRIKFKSGYTPTMGDSQTLVDTDENVWDIYKNSTDWTSVFEKNSKLVEVLGANTSSCTNMSYMFNYCTALTTVPLFDTSSCRNMEHMFDGCVNVQSGALALYQQASTQATVPSYHDGCFTNCGSNTVTVAAELAQIPTSWGGTMA